MNLTSIVWLGLFGLFSVLVFRRSSWGIPLYMTAYFAHPPNWWWGQGFLTSTGVRWNLLAALIFAFGVLCDPRPKAEKKENSTSQCFWLLLAYALNASVVHLLFAVNPDRSLEGLVLLWKQVGLFLLIWIALRDEFDMKILIYSVIIGSLYIGYEVVINGRGHFVGSRLEGVGIPGAAESNYLAALLCLSIPLAGGLLLVGNRWERMLAFVSIPFILETILRCNSRAAFLGLIIGAAWLLFRSYGKVRKYAFVGVALGACAAFMMIGDQRIIDRFLSTFAGAEQRDKSAESRLDFWMAASNMIADNPLGSGAEAAFKSELGLKYIAWMREGRQRAVHNGFLDIAASWGIQGLILFLSTIYIARRGARCTITWARAQSQETIAFLGICIDAALITQLINTMFISSLDGEWFYWWIALGLAYRRIYAVGVSEIKEVLNAEPVEVEPGDEDLVPQPIVV